METATPDLKEAKQLSDKLQFELKNNKFLSYNCSPSFNWSKFGFSDNELKNFNQELGKLGYSWQVLYINIINSLLLWLVSIWMHYKVKDFQRIYLKDLCWHMLKVSKEKRRNTMLINWDIRSKWIRILLIRWSGAELIDQIMMMANQSTLISCGEDSTEHQFDKWMLLIIYHMKSYQWTS